MGSRQAGILYIDPSALVEQRECSETNGVGTVCDGSTPEISRVPLLIECDVWFVDWSVDFCMWTEVDRTVKANVEDASF